MLFIYDDVVYEIEYVSLLSNSKRRVFIVTTEDFNYLHIKKVTIRLLEKMLNYKLGELSSCKCRLIYDEILDGYIFKLYSDGSNR